MRLRLIVLRDSDFSMREKKKAIQMINKLRRKYGLKPVSM